MVENYSLYFLRWLIITGKVIIPWNHKTIVMCYKNTKFVKKLCMRHELKAFQFHWLLLSWIWTLFAKPIITLLYVPVQWWFSLVKCAITCVCLVFSAYRSYCTRIYQTKELGQLRGPSKLLVKIKNPAADFIQVEPCSD